MAINSIKDSKAAPYVIHSLHNKVNYNQLNENSMKKLNYYLLNERCMKKLNYNLLNENCMHSLNELLMNEIPAATRQL